MVRKGIPSCSAVAVVAHIYLLDFLRTVPLPGGILSGAWWLFQASLPVYKRRRGLDMTKREAVDLECVALSLVEKVQLVHYL